MSFSAALQKFQDLGCEDQTKCAIACRIYEDLSNDKRLISLERFYDSELELLYIRGMREGLPMVYVPVFNSQQLDLLLLSKIQAKLPAPDAKSVTLAICDSTATILYYQITDGFVDKK